jgi:hypothetical protein
MASAPGSRRWSVTDDIEDHRQAAETVESGVGVRWTDETAQRAAGEGVAALRELAARIA